jgi:ketopantoate reductase
MNVLIVGAGAVGQVYGRHLQLGGADVSFYVKEKYVETCSAGFDLQVLNASGRGSYRFEGAGVVTDPEAVTATRWDQVWLCISATALRGPWLEPFLKAIGEATLVAMQPGLDDRAFLAEQIADDQIVQGMISMVSYQAPLAGEDREPGVAYWFPPLSPSPFSGPNAERVQAVVDGLKAGKCPAKVHANASLEAARGSAILMPHLAALELEAWSLKGLRKSERLAIATAASKEALATVAAYTETAVPGLMSCLVRPCLMGLVLGIAPTATPFPLEVYLKYHFTKVGDQTRFMIETYIETGKKHGLESPNLATLLASLPEIV